jgi:flagellar basal-body rod protein FlgG
MRDTGNPLDLAIEDRGFLRVRRADGTDALTRDGSLKLDPQGRLTTQRGDLVQPAITVPEGTKESDIQIAPDGAVTANNRALGRIQLVTVRSPDGLESVGDSLFRATATSGPATALAAGRVQQASVEASNVDVADSMTEMMDAQRSFQLASKAVQMQDQLLQIANQVKA